MAKTVFITGASSGIGKSSVRLFLEKGWNVAATMRSPDKDNGLDSSGNLIKLRLDVTERSSIQSAIQDTLKHFGGIDVVVNNAGYALVGPFEEVHPDRIEKQFQTNVFGIMNVTREVLPIFREKKSGIIINISSVGGRVTFPLYSLYHGTKWAVEGFSESLQYELKSFGIKIKLVEPGPIKTDFYSRSMDKSYEKVSSIYKFYVEKSIPKMNKIGEEGYPPEIVAKTIYRAATDGKNKLRYPSDFKSRSMIMIRRLIPESWFMAIVRKVVGS